MKISSLQISRAWHMDLRDKLFTVECHREKWQLDPQIINQEFIKTEWQAFVWFSSVLLPAEFLPFLSLLVTCAFPTVHSFIVMLSCHNYLFFCPDSSSRSLDVISINIIQMVSPNQPPLHHHSVTCSVFGEIQSLGRSPLTVLPFSWNINQIELLMNVFHQDRWCSEVEQKKYFY